MHRKDFLKVCLQYDCAKDFLMSMSKRISIFEKEFHAFCVYMLNNGYLFLLK